MRRKAAIIGLVVPALAYGWIIAASAIYLAGTGKLDLFRFPFAQWLEAAPWWRLNWVMTLWVTTAAVLPTLLLALCAFGLVRHWWWNERPVLYGKTDWATGPQMKAGGIAASRKPF